MVYKFFDKKSVGANLNLNLELAKNFIKQLLKKLIREKCVHHTETILGVLI